MQFIAFPLKNGKRMAALYLQHINKELEFAA